MQYRYSAPVGDTEYCYEHVCVCTHISETTRPSSPNFLRVRCLWLWFGLPLARGDAAMKLCCVLPFMLMTSCFHIMACPYCSRQPRCPRSERANTPAAWRAYWLSYVLSQTSQGMSERSLQCRQLRNELTATQCVHGHKRTVHTLFPRIPRNKLVCQLAYYSRSACSKGHFTYGKGYRLASFVTLKSSSVALLHFVVDKKSVFQLKTPGRETVRHRPVRVGLLRVVESACEGRMSTMH